MSTEKALAAWVRALDSIKIIEQQPDVVFPQVLNSLADLYGDAPALRGADTQLSYRELAQSANQYARWAEAEGIATGEAVALLLRNCPEYVAIWAGLTQAGYVAALINTNLVGDALAHCICAAAPRHIIVGYSLLPAVNAIMARLPTGVTVWVHGEASAAAHRRIDADVEQYDNAPFERREGSSLKSRDSALLIYTSGTTGLPKAAKVTHGRIMEWSYWFAGMMGVQSGDRLYNCLPMYHSTGGVVAIGAMLVKGASVVIRERFSASRFWDDVTQNQCTIYIYIGELCRYLLHSPPHAEEARHQLRLCCGNGLRADVWEGFQQRFRIPRILEFYAATEGNVSLYNCEGKPGAIGRVPAFLANRFPLALVKCDAASGGIIRDEGGFCIECGFDEVGEAIGRIDTTDQSPARQFDGYTDQQASDKKVLRNAFVQGDYWFRTGDLMRKDRAGYYYFVDRIGDTFRWKGENVSSTEVAGVAGACPGVTGVIVYGVAVPGHEGRAGMAAITVNETFLLKALHAHLAANLPEYARPLFVRICQSLETTQTFKLKKDKLQAEGFAAPSPPDSIWFNDGKSLIPREKCGSFLQKNRRRAARTKKLF